jgi:arylsulfatase/arylsulfatase A
MVHNTSCIESSVAPRKHRKEFIVIHVGAVSRVVLTSLAMSGFVCLRTSLAAESTATVERPNIILIVTDDQGWGDLSCHGNPVLQTPHIDRLAARGAELTRFYVSPVCSPTRACLMTGRYNYRTRVIDTYRGRSMMDPAEVTVAELLRDAEYATGIFGKWHLGDCYPLRPQDQGFDETVVIRGGGLAQPSEPLENEGRYTNPLLWRNGEQFTAEGYCTDVFFDEAERFIEASAGTGRPFFAFITPNAPHGPLNDVPQELYRNYKALDLTSVLLGNDESADTVARIYAMVENIDSNVGRLMATLDRLAIADNTLVLFMCDNGPNTRRYVGRRRGMKTDVLEGGIAAPLIAHWPQRIKPGTTNDGVAAHIDMLPTLLAAAQVEVPGDLNLDGRSFLPLLTESSPSWPDRTLFIQAHRGDPVPGHNAAVVTPRWKLVHSSGFDREAPPPEVPFALYDLPEDPHEDRDLAADHPDVVAELRRRYDAWYADVSSERPDNFAPPHIILGADAAPETTLTRQDWQPVGAGWGDQGEWLVTVARPAGFAATVILQRPAAGEATIRIGESAVRQTIKEPQQRIEFNRIDVPAGDGAVHFELIGDNAAVPPYQLTLKRL